VILIYCQWVGKSNYDYGGQGGLAYVHREAVKKNANQQRPPHVDRSLTDLWDAADADSAMLWVLQNARDQHFRNPKTL
jgi:hypothetical protein